MSAPNQRNKRQKGQLLLMTTLLVVPMLGMLGLVTDLGYMHFVKMSAQTAAEAAAMGAIISYHETVGGAAPSCGGNVICSANSPTACASNITNPQNPIDHGCMYAQNHGFNGSNQMVTYQSNVSSTPPTAPGSGTAVYWVTFRVVQKVPQMFSAVLGNPAGLVAARSTAAVVGSTDCIYALDHSHAATVSVSGTGSLTSSCGIFDDSNNPCAIQTNGSGNGTGLTASEYDVVGGTCTQGIPLTPSPNLGVAPVSDPLASLPVPGSAPYTCGPGYPNGSGNGSTIALNPGVYCGGINVKNNTVNLNPGNYILVGGGLTTQDNNSHINGTGVMFYNTFDPNVGNNNYRTYSPINIVATSTVSLTAPITGTYSGILIFEDRNGYCGNPATSPCSDTYGGGSSAVYQGIIYARNSNITMYGNSSVNASYTGVIANQISLVGTTGFNSNYSSLPGGRSPLQTVSLLE